MLFRFITILLFLPILTYAQDDIIQIGVLPSELGEGMPLRQFKEFERNVVEYLDKVDRFEVLKGPGDYEEMDWNWDIQSTTDQIIQVGNNSNTNFLLQLVFGDTEWIDNQSAAFNQGRIAQLWVTINLYNVTSGSLEKSITLTASSGETGSGGIYTSAVNAAQRKLWEKTKFQLLRIFPLNISVTELTESPDEDEAFVSINAGKFHGIEKGDEFKVYHEKEYQVRGAAKQRHITEGTISVEKVNPQTALCKIKKGKKDIVQLLKEGKKLKCLTNKSITKEEQLSLGVLLFQPKGVEEFEARKVSRSIETSLQQTNRFKIVTRQLLHAINLERETQKENIDQIAIEQGKAIGATYIVWGTVNAFQKGISRKRDRNGALTSQTSTVTQVIYTIKIIEVKTGVIKATDTYSGSQNGIDHHIRNFIRTEFPYDFSILEVLKKKGDKKAKLVLLDGGHQQGLKKGVILEVFESSEEDIGGQILKREVKVGDLMLRRLDTSGDFSVASIYKGKKNIMQKMQNGTKLICKIPKKCESSEWSMNMNTNSCKFPLRSNLQDSIRQVYNLLYHKKMKRTFQILFLFFLASSLEAQPNDAPTQQPLIQPSIMVIPFVKADEDLRTIYEHEHAGPIRTAITRVKDAVDQDGLKTIDFRAILKQFNNQEAMTTDQQASIKQRIIELSAADIYIESETQVVRTPTGNSVTVILTAYDAYTGLSLANKLGHSPKFYTENYEKLAEKAVDTFLNEFMDALHYSLRDMIENGRTIALDIGFAEEANLDMDSELGDNGDLLSDLLETWLEENAYNSYFHIQGITATKMIVDAVKIPVIDPDTNRNYRPSKFVTKLRKYLIAQGFEVTRYIQGGKIFLTLSD